MLLMRITDIFLAFPKLILALAFVAALGPGIENAVFAIARALILEPEIILLDEPTSALDVSIQAEVLNLLKQVQKSRTLTYLLVSHDLAVVSHMCGAIAVMNQGAVVEYLTQKQLREGDTRHPYTRQLMAASRGFGRRSIEKQEAIHETP